MEEVVGRDFFLKESPQESFDLVSDLNFSDVVKHLVGMDVSVMGLAM